MWQNIVTVLGIVIVAGLAIVFKVSGEGKEVAMSAIQVLGGAIGGAAATYAYMKTKPEDKPHV